MQQKFLQRLTRKGADQWQLVEPTVRELQATGAKSSLVETAVGPDNHHKAILSSSVKRKRNGRCSIGTRRKLCFRLR
jgi:hypothetical protein